MNCSIPNTNALMGLGNRLLREKRQTTIRQETSPGIRRGALPNGRGTNCRQKQNGNTPAGQARLHLTVLARRLTQAGAILVENSPQQPQQQGQSTHLILGCSMTCT